MSEPSESCIVVQQDHGPGGGGWGIAAYEFPTIGGGPQPIVYSGSDPQTIEALKRVCQTLAQATGKPTRLARYTQREDLYVVGGSS
jgi:hypothetical protein